MLHRNYIYIYKSLCKSDNFNFFQKNFTFTSKMVALYAVISILISLLIVQESNAITSPIQPYTNYRYSTELQNNVADLWWTVDETKHEILFELHIKTTGWIALGISPGTHLFAKIIIHFSLSLSFLISWWNDRC